MKQSIRLIGLLVVIGLAGCESAVFAPTPSPTFYEIFPLPDTPLPGATGTPLPDASPPTGAADLRAFIRTSVAPPICYDAHSRIGALVTVENTGTADAGPFMVAVDGVWQAVPQGLAAGGSMSLWFDGSVYARPWARMTVTVDAADQVAESDESNNTATEFVATLTPPPLCPTATRRP